MARRKKKKASGKILITVIALPVIAAVAYYSMRYGNKPKFVRYDGFGIDMPVNYPIHGIDVSRHQATIDWQDVKEMQVRDIKIGFGFIKATEGTQNVDEQYKANWLAAKESAIPRGAYHFFNPSKSGKAQAKNFIETVQLDKGDLPPALDVEQINGVSVPQLQQGISDWLQMVGAHYNVKPIIYTNAYFYKNFLGDKFNDYPLWVAHYLVKDKPRINRNWLFWQHNETGQVNGISSYVDFNVFNGDSAAFKAMLIK